MAIRTKEIAKTYDPTPIEDKWYSWWLESGLFHAEVDTTKEAFSIVIPPPNVTGSLHMGHAFNNTFQDIVCRYKRMNGFNVLWLPGTDHAGIATQNVVERELAKNGISRHDLGREEFVNKVWEWKEEYGSRIIEQMKKLGNSCDWERERFTLDEGLSQAVRTVFVRLYKKGLIYKGRYIINWCPRCHTALSDIEVEHEDLKGCLYYVKYPFVEGEGHLLVATTRPETILGDVAIAVHPRAEKYRHMIGKKVCVPLTDREVPIIEDIMVDPEFGTGCVKITPAHDPNDFLVGQRHNLEQIQVIDADGFMNENAPAYKGLPILEARERAVEDLKAQGLIEKIEEIDHSVGHCYRCHTVVEPYLSEQWFVKAKPLADAGIEAVEKGDITWIPEQWQKIYYQWMENIRDWCISRQLWWGHRIPAWTCAECGHITVSEEDPTHCEKCGSARIQQDEDVLDTWFSSALWPFSTLGWPEKTEELNYFYPTSLLVTAFDIIFFWVARMIMMGLEFMENEPFKEVYIHALIRDEDGQKMSKSKGNVIDPLTMIDKYGADALRLTLAALTVQGRDILLSTNKIETYRLFMNKLWNASRFALMNLEENCSEKPLPDKGELRLHDQWILTRTQQVIEQITRLLDGYFIGEAARMLYDFIWGDLCDWYLEMSKPALKGDEGELRVKNTQAIVEYVFKTVLKLIHPFIPFATEELWHTFGFSDDSIERSEWPKASSALIFNNALSGMGTLQEIIRIIRNLRAEARVAPQQKVERVILQTDDDALKALVSANMNMISLLARVERVDIISDSDKKPHGCLASVMTNGEISLEVGSLLDIKAEIERLEQELKSVEKDIDKMEKKLANKNFTSKAPQEVVDKERGRLEENRNHHQRIADNISSLKRS
ncbi:MULTISPECIES: valine--tRNA ligase [Aminobacterium]|jgi:valyl-tRNA synthetase|uniref:valine--tRNA ligase n=1 Tax=Aminobacterium TaxID=81466 RepID=UPI00257A2002|nr:valine--tRNA ligase [Aminobacterium sp. UBA4987]